MSKCDCQFEIDKKYEKFKKEIEEVQDGPYSHNIISSILRQCKNELGAEYADHLIDDLGLDYGKAS